MIAARVPSTPSSASATAACITCLRASGFRATIARIRKTAPTNAGISAVTLARPGPDVADHAEQDQQKSDGACE